MINLERALYILKHEVGKNVSWQFFERFLGLGLTFLVSICVIRFLGPQNYGILSYSTSYVVLFSSLTTCGLQTIVVKELIAKQIDASLIMGSALAIMLLGSTLAFILAISGSIIMNDSKIVIEMITFSCLANIVASFSVVNFYFQADLKARYTTYVLLGQDMVDAIAKLVLVYLKTSVVAIGALVFIEAIAIYFILYLLYKKIYHGLTWNFKISTIVYLIRESFPLAISGAVINLYMRLDQVMIEHYKGLSAVGEYSVGIKLIEVLGIVPVIISSNIFPVMVKKLNESRENFDNLMRILYKNCFYVSLVAVVIISILAETLVHLVYGEKYQLSGQVFHYGIFSLCFMSLGMMNHLWLQVNGLQRYAVFITLSGLISCFFMNLILIPKYGILGAVFAMLVTQFMASVLAFAFFEKTRKSFVLFIQGIMLLK